MLLTRLTPELCGAVILQLPPRHVYKLMQTNKQFHKYCLSEAYWALYLVLPPEMCTPKEMVLLRKSYCDTMDDFIQSVRDEQRTFLGAEAADGPVERLAVICSRFSDEQPRDVLGLMFF